MTFTWIVAVEQIVQYVRPVGAATPQINQVIVGDACVAIAKVRRVQVLQAVNARLRSFVPLERERVEYVHIN